MDLVFFVRELRTSNYKLVIIPKVLPIIASTSSLLHSPTSHHIHLLSLSLHLIILLKNSLFLVLRFIILWFLHFLPLPPFSSSSPKIQQVFLYTSFNIPVWLQSPVSMASTKRVYHNWSSSVHHGTTINVSNCIPLSDFSVSSYMDWTFKEGNSWVHLPPRIVWRVIEFRE